MASLNLSNANTWAALQTFGNNISLGGATLNVSSLASNEVLRYNGTNWINASIISDTAYDATSWDSVTTIAASKNAVRDQIETMLTSIAGKEPAITTLAVTKGGTGIASGNIVEGDILIGTAADTLARLAKNTTATRYLANTGTNNRPAWTTVNLTNGVNSVLPMANGGTNITAASLTNGTVMYYDNTNSRLFSTAFVYTGTGLDPTAANSFSIGSLTRLLTLNSKNVTCENSLPTVRSSIGVTIDNDQDIGTQPDACNPGGTLQVRINGTLYTVSIV